VAEMKTKEAPRGTTPHEASLEIKSMLGSRREAQPNDTTGVWGVKLALRSRRRPREG